MVKQYLILFAHSLPSFRIEELTAVAQYHAIKIHYDAGNAVDLSTPFMVVGLESDEDARKLGARAVLIRSIYELWVHEPTYEAVHAEMKKNDAVRALWSAHSDGCSFRFEVTAFGSRLSDGEQRNIMNSFSYMGWTGPIRMRDPDVEVSVIEEYPPSIEGRKPYESERLGIWVGRKICVGQRELVNTFDVKKRVYIGNTTMEAEVSLVMANQAHAGPGKLVYDPFVGTGSMLYTSAWFGATCVGSDIDARHIRGKEKGKSLFDSAAQYGVRHRILDCLNFDLTQNPWRVSGIFDAIITDPPYGVRAGAKRLGRKDENRVRDTPYIMENGIASHELPNYVPPSKPWEMSEVLLELLRQALVMLKPGGRLVYWLPTVTSEYKDSDVPQMKGLKLIANSEQSFGKWARRLITMVKLNDTQEEIDGAGAGADSSQAGAPGHFDFRDAYFKKFPDRAAPTEAGRERDTATL